MPPAADGMAGHPEQSQDGAGHHGSNADSPDDGKTFATNPMMRKTTPRTITFSS
jgi:hypothetical protein